MSEPCRCPLCGGEIKPEKADMVALRVLSLPPMQRRVLDIFLAAHPRPLMGDWLVERVYADDPDGGPDAAYTAVAVQINRLNKAIRPLGWEIKGARGPGSMGRTLRKIMVPA